MFRWTSVLSGGCDATFKNVDAVLNLCSNNTKRQCGRCIFNLSNQPNAMLILLFRTEATISPLWMFLPITWHLSCIPVRSNLVVVVSRGYINERIGFAESFFRQKTTQSANLPLVDSVAIPIHASRQMATLSSG